MMLSAGNSIVIRQEADGDILASLYPTLPGVDRSSLRSIGAEDLAPVTHFRFDPVAACNVRCVFCHSDFSGQARQLDPQELATAFAFDMPSLRTIAVGCAYEPTMSKHFEAYPQVLSAYRGKARARIITNGLLLHRKDLAPWAAFGVEYLHVSVHSHLPDVYEQTMRSGADLDQLAHNLKQVRIEFPEIPIHLINVVCRTNTVAIADYCRWAFDEIGASEVMLARAYFSETPSPGYPAASYVAEVSSKGDLPGLTDEEWKSVLSNCLEFMDDSTVGAIKEGGMYAPTVRLRHKNN